MNALLYLIDPFSGRTRAVRPAEIDDEGRIAYITGEPRRYGEDAAAYHERIVCARQPTTFRYVRQRFPAIVYFLIRRKPCPAEAKYVAPVTRIPDFEATPEADAYAAEAQREEELDEDARRREQEEGGRWLL